LGADGSCMSNNPAGIGLYKKGDINISFGLKFNAVEASHNGTINNNFKASVPFDGLTLVGAWDSKTQPDNHHAIGLSCNQIANFNSNTTIAGNANFKSIANDFLNTSNGKSLNNLDNSFGGMAYDNYLIDVYDTVANKYISLINTKYDLSQSKNIEDIQVFVGSFTELQQHTKSSIIYFREHPLNKHYKGNEDARVWMIQTSQPVQGSFFSFWKKYERQIEKEYF
jgi:hypothetical protein